MGNDIAVFDFNAKKVRTLTVDGEVLFRASDVAKVLGVQTNGLLSRIPEKEISLADLLSEGGIQKTKFLRESGLYRAILRSDKPEAEKFIEWVTNEVLPSIRKQGFYVTEKLKDELAAQNVELARKEQVILSLQKKKRKSPRVSVPNYNVLDGFEPKMEMMRIEDLLEPEKSMAALRRIQAQIEGFQKKERILKNILKFK
jgi:prophage antirepressor-like protein